MPIGPDGTVVEGPSSDDDTGAVSGAEREAEGPGGTKPVGGAGAHPCKECRPQSPGPIDELIAALREATLGPAHPRCHGLDPLPNLRPESKFNPQFLKESQVKDLMLIC